MEEYLASIIMWPLSWVPQNYLPCNGALINLMQNQALYSLLGTVYGGDGKSTFGLPDFRGRVPVGIDDTNFLFAHKGGSYTNPVNVTGSGTGGSFTLTAANLPAHTHAINAATVSIAIPANSTGSGNTNTPGTTMVFTKGNAVNGLSSYPANIYNSAAANTTIAPFDVTIPASTSGSTGNAQPTAISNLLIQATGPAITIQPWIAINFIICTSGIYPPRP